MQKSANGVNTCTPVIGTSDRVAENAGVENTGVENAAPSSSD